MLKILIVNDGGRGKFNAVIKYFIFVSHQSQSHLCQVSRAVFEIETSVGIKGDSPQESPGLLPEEWLSVH